MLKRMCEILKVEKKNCIVFHSIGILWNVTTCSDASQTQHPHVEERERTSHAPEGCPAVPGAE